MAVNWNDFTPIEPPKAKSKAVDWTQFEPITEPTAEERANIRRGLNPDGTPLRPGAGQGERGVTKPWYEERPKDEDEGITALDTFATAVGGAIEGTGNALAGLGRIGQMSRENQRRLIARQEEARRLGIPVSEVPLDDSAIDFQPTPGAEELKREGRGTQALASEGFREDMQRSGIEGELFSPSTWGLKEGTTVRGMLGQGARIGGQMAPIAAAAFVPGAGPLLAVGGASGQGGEGAYEEQSQRILNMPIEELSQVPEFIELAKRMPAEQARRELAGRAGETGMIAAAPIAGVSGLIPGGQATAVTRGLATRALGSNVAGRTVGELPQLAMEGAQEAIETGSTIGAVNRETGESRSIMEGSLENFVLGAAGAGPGVVAGALSPSEADYRAEAETLKAQKQVAETPEQHGTLDAGIALAEARAGQAAKAPWRVNKAAREAAKGESNVEQETGTTQASVPAVSGRGESVQINGDANGIPARMEVPQNNGNPVDGGTESVAAGMDSGVQRGVQDTIDEAELDRLLTGAFPDEAVQVDAEGQDVTILASRNVDENQGVDGDPPENDAKNLGDSGIEAEELSDAEAERQWTEAIEGKSDALTEGFRSLAANPELMKTPLYKGATAKEVIENVGPGFIRGPQQYDDDPLAPSTFSPVMVTQRFLADDGSIRTAVNEARIHESPTHVWVDVSRLEEGGGGAGQIYAAAHSLAANTGRKISEDPKGLSDAAVVRRPGYETSAILKAGSSAGVEGGPYLASDRSKHGGTKNRPIPLNPVPRVNDDLRERLLTMHSNATRAVPEVKGIRYDPDTNQFRRPNGAIVDDNAFEGLARARFADPIRETMVGERTDPGNRSASPIGRDTLKVAALVETLQAITDPESRAAVVEKLRSLASNGSGLGVLSGILPSRRTEDRPAISNPENTKEGRRAWVQNTARALADYANKASGQPDKIRRVEDSSNAAGFSSYFYVGPQEVRVSDHSKSPHNAVNYVHVQDADDANRVMDMIDKAAPDFMEKRAAGRNVYFSEVAEDGNRSGDTPAQVGSQTAADNGRASGQGSSDGRGSVSVDAIRDTIAKRYGRRAKRLLESGRTKIVQSERDVPSEIRSRSEPLASADGTIQGFYDQKTGESYLLADNFKKLEDVGPVFLHEEGVHAGMKGMLGDKFPSIARRLKSIAKSGPEAEKGIVQKARKRVDRAGTPEQHADEELVAYTVQLAEAAALPSGRLKQWLEDVYAAIKLWAANKGLVNLSVNDIRLIARGALGHRARLDGGTVAPSRTDKDTITVDGKERSGDSILASRVDRTPEQEEALEKAGMPVDNRNLAQRLRDKVKDQWSEVRELAAGNIKQRVFDRFDRMRAIEQNLGVKPEDSAYLSARLAVGLPSIMESIMLYGAPEWQNGILGQKQGTVGLLDALKPIAGDIDGWLGWMVGRRAQVLKNQGRENLMSDADIAALLSLSKGKEAEFKKAALGYLKIKEAVLDVAEKAGLIDPTTRATWDHVEYIPFYRADDADPSMGPGTKKALANQPKQIKRLQGGKQNLSDPLGNIVKNFTQLIDASLKNNAMLEAVDQYGTTFFEKQPMSGGFERIPLSQIKALLLDRGVPQSVIDAMPAGTLSGLQKMWAVKPPDADDVVRVMRDGKPEYYKVPDPDLLLSLTSFKPPTKDWYIKPFIWLKRLLTAGVTASPEFMARNFIRDSGSSWILADDKFRLGWDSAKGVIKPLMDESDKRAMMFAGGSFIGGQIHGGSPDETAKALRRSLREKGLNSKQIEDHIATIAATPLKLWDKWQAFGSALENANRNAIYENAIKAGRSPKEAAYLARDLMDFAMQGDSRFIQVLADVLPFFNARLQGLYKLYRQGGKKALRKALLMRAGTVTAATVGLLAWNLLMYGDGYDELEEWDKDTYWHIAPGTKNHIRIPKPFELGALFATVPERVAQSILGNDRPGVTAKQIGAQVWGTLAMNPVPQGVMPVAELWANKSFFTGRPIENIGDQNLLPEARAEWYTSDTAQLISGQIGNASGMSPKRLEHLWNGYTGTMGAYALDLTDAIVRQIQDKPDRPELAWSEMPVLKAMYRGDMVPKSTKHTTDFYELLDKANDVSGTIKEYEVSGRKDDAAELEAKWAWLLGERVTSKQAKAGFMHSSVKEFNKARDRLSAIRKEMEGIIAMPGITPEQKREQIDALAIERNALSKQIAKKYRAKQ